MLFNSIPYFIFFPVVLAAFWLAPKSVRRPLLLVASYVFYMSWIPAYGALIAALTAVNYFIGLGLGSGAGEGVVKSAAAPGRKLLFIAGLVVNLGALCFFKYTNFLLSNVSAVFGWWSVSTHNAAQLPSFTFDVILPLGISFFAFEFIHYLADVYRGGVPIRNVVDFGLFAAFFPSQLAGPIKRYQDFVAQLGKGSVFSGEQFNRGLFLFFQGLFKKAALADNVAAIANRGFGNVAMLGTSDAWLTALAFTLQIYFDFSGYTDMGRGSALMLGFELPDNFNFPYLAQSLQDFWRRWHISLSSWLRDYLYIPLGGSKHGDVAKCRNLMITMLLGGLWHGAAWHFVVWGGIHGGGLVVNHVYDNVAQRVPALKAFHDNAVGVTISTLLTLAFVVFGWIFFRADTLADACGLLQAMITPRSSSLLAEMLQSSTAMYALVVYAVYATIFALPNYAGNIGFGLLDRIRGAADGLGTPARVVACIGVALAVIGFAPAQPSPFIYFQF